MPLIDLPLETLREYRPDIDEPADFDAFWAETIAESRAAARTGIHCEPAETPIRELAIDDVTFPGFGGEPVRAWLTRPRGHGDPLPVVVEFVGYGGGRAQPGERLQWAAAGYAHLLMDTRGQGGTWGGGHTPDPHGSDSATPGFMTRGIADPHDYYYRRVFTDGVRLIDAVGDIPGADASRIAVTGGSQGGGISIAVAALSPAVRAVMPDVPFLSHFRRAVEATPAAPFTEITKYLSVHRDRIEATFRTLSYFDGANFTPRIHAPALFSVGLMDEIVLPSTVFAAYNRLGSADRSIEVYPYNGHEGGQMHQWVRQARWLAERLAAVPSGERMPVAADT
ncbi:acetylxylan esterase [Agromyces archimandritae]|uniref:Acetylxylan esterase n=1 Tax=Agromyces archimandritae TaxID=2781962 RepID=A0A975IQ50_9MICO|nr:acetylxylan esterase [Agromyces archimandritae]QTX05974.1 acetylxylan esterase [Agromyces archimandritae]